MVSRRTLLRRSGLTAVATTTAAAMAVVFPEFARKAKAQEAPSASGPLPPQDSDGVPPQDSDGVPPEDSDGVPVRDNPIGSGYPQS